MFLTIKINEQEVAKNSRITQPRGGFDWEDLAPVVQILSSCSKRHPNVSQLVMSQFLGHFSLPHKLPMRGKLSVAKAMSHRDDGGATSVKVRTICSGKQLTICFFRPSLLIQQVGWTRSSEQRSRNQKNRRKILYIGTKSHSNLS